MPFHTVREIIEYSATVYGELANYFESLPPALSDERTRCTAQIIGSHHHQVADSLNQYLTEGNDNVLDTWLQYAPKEEFLTCIPNFKQVVAESTEELIHTYVSADNCMLNLYQNAATHSDIPEVEEVIDSLTTLLKTNQQQVSWALASNLDV